jgi:hypothetical protein
MPHSATTPTGALTGAVPAFGGATDGEGVWVVGAVVGTVVGSAAFGSVLVDSVVVGSAVLGSVSVGGCPGTEGTVEDGVGSSVDGVAGRG